MTIERASIFGDDEDGPDAVVDLSDFVGRPRERQKVDPQVMLEAAEGSKFRSREPGAKSGVAPSTKAPAGRRRAIRPTRSVQLNVRITPDHHERFMACLDLLGQTYSQADGVELAIERLEASLGVGAAPVRGGDAEGEGA